MAISGESKRRQSFFNNDEKKRREEKETRRQEDRNQRAGSRVEGSSTTTIDRDCFWSAFLTVQTLCDDSLRRLLG